MASLFLRAGLGIVLLALGAAPGRAAAPVGFADSAALLGRGINLGNALEAPREGEWGVTLKEAYFPAIAAAGFGTVRVPIRWTAHALAAAPYTVDPAFFARVDWVVAQAAQNRLRVALDFHNDEELTRDPAAARERFLALWRQIAEHYRTAPPEVLFELCNEPHARLDAARWNALFPEALAVVRASNPDRLVVVGGANWSGPDALGALVLPEGDRRLVATFHFYLPMAFTHQGAEWNPGSEKDLGTPWNGTPEEKAPLERKLDAAAAWARAHDRPLWMGEFGAYNKAALDARVRWTAFVARAAEERGLAWAYWEFCAGFGAYDPQADRWRQPLLDALIPH